MEFENISAYAEHVKLLREADLSGSKLSTLLQRPMANVNTWTSADWANFHHASACQFFDPQMCMITCAGSREYNRI